MPSDKLSFVRKQQAEADDYNQSVVGLHAFAASCAWNEAGRCIRPETRTGIPRRMRILSADDGDVRSVTPDAVVQVTEDYGVVAEMKKHFPTRDMGEPFEQAAIYGQPLIGWWTSSERITQHDVVLLTHVGSATASCDAYEAWCALGNSMPGRFAIVEFGYLQQGQLWFLLRRRAGSLGDSVHDERLRQGKNLDVVSLTNIFSQRKFMDHEPPSALMLFLVFTYALPLFSAEGDFEKATGKRYPVATVTPAEVTECLRDQFCPDSGEPGAFSLPRQAWVVKALELLASMGLATRVSGPGTRYRVVLRKPAKKDLIVFFAERLHQLNNARQRSERPEQPDFFP